MSIIIQILISLTTSILVVIVYFLLRQQISRKRKSTTTSSLEIQISDLKLKVANLEQKIYNISQTGNNRQNAGSTITCDEASGNKNKQKESRQNSQQSNMQMLTQQEDKPKDATFTYLSISEGKLVEVASGQASYYRAWKHKGKILFEFFCDPQRTKKAINNRSAIIEPCCIKDEKSIEPDMASSIITVRNGELDNNFNIISKAKIKFT